MVHQWLRSHYYRWYGFGRGFSGSRKALRSTARPVDRRLFVCLSIGRDRNRLISGLILWFCLFILFVCLFVCLFFVRWRGASEYGRARTGCVGFVFFFSNGKMACRRRAGRPSHRPIPISHRRPLPQPFPMKNQQQQQQQQPKSSPNSTRFQSISFELYRVLLGFT